MRIEVRIQNNPVADAKVDVQMVVDDATVPVHASRRFRNGHALEQEWDRAGGEEGGAQIFVRQRVVRCGEVGQCAKRCCVAGAVKDGPTQLERERFATDYVCRSRNGECQGEHQLSLARRQPAPFSGDDMQSDKRVRENLVDPLVAEQTIEDARAHFGDLAHRWLRRVLLLVDVGVMSAHQCRYGIALRKAGQTPTADR